MIRTTSKYHDTMIIKHQVMFLAIVRHVQIVCLGWVLCCHCVNLMSKENAASQNSYVTQVASILSCTRVDEYNSPLPNLSIKLRLVHNHSYKNEFNLHVNKISFSYERTCIKTRFEKEGQVNSTSKLLAQPIKMLEIDLHELNHLKHFHFQNPMNLFSKLRTCLTQGLTPCLILSFLTSFSCTPIILPSCLSENPACLASNKSSRSKDPLKFNITRFKFIVPVAFVRAVAVTRRQADNFRVYSQVFALWFDWILNTESSSSVNYGLEELPKEAYIPLTECNAVKSGTQTAGSWPLRILGFV